MHKKDRLEASGIQLFRNHYYVVFDNTSAIAKIHVSLDKHHSGNELLAGPESMNQFEDITYSQTQKKFYVVIENAEYGSGAVTEASNTSSIPKSAGFKAKICEYDEQFNLLETQPVDFEFENENKGLEGLAVINRNNKDYVLGLCEAAGTNNARVKVQNQPGTGTMLVLEKAANQWRVVRTIYLPQCVQFGDYAGLDIKDHRIAVVSQVSATLWVGEFKEDSWEFVDKGRIYQFPLNKRNKVKYCNVEGVAWIDNNTIAVVSDKRKTGNARRCKKQDQSIHVFELPD